MSDRAKRLNEVYEFLHDNQNVHTKGDFADIMNYARAYISSALNGNEKYLTDKLFKSVCEKYPDIFNLDYLLNGTGELLAQPEPSPGIDKEEEVNKIIRIYEKEIQYRENELCDLKLKHENELRDLKMYHATAVNALKEENSILKERIAELTAQLSQYQSADVMTRFPFPHGVADPKKDQTNPL